MGDGDTLVMGGGAAFPREESACQDLVTTAAGGPQESVDNSYSL